MLLFGLFHCIVLEPSGRGHRTYLECKFYEKNTRERTCHWPRAQPNVMALCRDDAKYVKKDILKPLKFLVITHLLTMKLAAYMMVKLLTDIIVGFEPRLVFLVFWRRLN